MNRRVKAAPPVWVLCVVAALALAGCKGNKKDASNPKGADAKSQGDSKKPDAFESSDDPPFNAQTRFAAGQLAESQGKADVAIQQYQEAVKLDPKYRQALFRLGALYAERKQYAESIEVWQRYLAATNRSPAAYSNLALVHEQAGNFGEAEKAYQAGLERDPKDPACRVNYGLMLARQGRTDDAIAQFQTVLTPAEVHYNLGSVCQQQGQRSQAIAYYQKALELDPKLADARARLAELK